jgi:hypothetical protein
LPPFIYQTPFCADEALPAILKQPSVPVICPVVDYFFMPVYRVLPNGCIGFYLGHETKITIPALVPFTFHHGKGC